MAERPVEVVPEVAAVLGKQGLRPLTATVIGGERRWRKARITYRIELEGGGTIKVRKVGRRIKPRRVAELAAALDDPAIPVPLVAGDSIFIESWVDGIPLSDRTLGEDDLDAAADLLGRLHARRELPGIGFRRLHDTRARARQTEERLERLAELGVISRDERRRAASVLRRLPARAEWGVTHGDLCDQNLIARPDGSLVSIDNEGLRLDFLDVDLARTWSRWPMASRAWGRFERRYEQRRGSPLEEDEERAWRIVAATKTAWLWRARPPQGEATGVAVLRRALADRH